jgi:hypothetical protein
MLLCSLTAVCCAFTWWHYQVNSLRAYFKSTTIDGFVVYSLWHAENGQNRLVYILAYPDGNEAGGGSANAFGSFPGNHGVFTSPDGIFVRGQNRFSANDAPSVWIYLTSKPGGEVRKLEVSPESIERFSPKDFDSLATSELWKDELRPALVEESICFSEWYLRTHGSRSPPRFTRPTGTP